MLDSKLLLGLCSIGAMIPAADAAAKEKKTSDEEKPNLLIIITDQQRSDAMGIAGKYKFLKTPNIDRLANEGARFENAYTPCAVSGPGRACLLTGMLVEHTGVLKNETVDMDPIENNFTKLPTYDQVLQRNGWHTEFHGSWHGPSIWLGEYENTPWHKHPTKPHGYVFEESVEYMDMLREKYGERPHIDGALTEDTYKVEYMPDPMDRSSVYGFDSLERLNGPYPKIQPDNHGILLIDDCDTKSAFQAGKGMEAIRRYTDSDEPFAITIAFSSPHSPLVPTEKYYNMYDLKDMPLPASIDDTLGTSPYRGLIKWQRPQEYSDPQRVPYMMKEYFALVSEVDEWVGEIMKELERCGKADNTLVVFMADHGDQLCEHGMREKNTFFEGSEKVPFIFWYPKVIKPRLVKEFTSTMDLFPTIMDYMGIKDYDLRDARSARSKIEGRYKGQNYAVTEWLYHGINSPSHMVVKKGWKLMLNYSKESPIIYGLYNLRKDPNELDNLLNPDRKIKRRHIRKAENLKATLAAHLKERDSKYAESISELEF